MTTTTCLIGELGEPVWGLRTKLIGNDEEVPPPQAVTAMVAAIALNQRWRARRFIGYTSFYWVSTGKPDGF
jgi:hypothetical protein